jgi:hypothetical protein
MIKENSKEITKEGKRVPISAVFWRSSSSRANFLPIFHPDQTIVAE